MITKLGVKSLSINDAVQDHLGHGLKGLKLLLDDRKYTVHERRDEIAMKHFIFIEKY